jgi:hypothetical protein
MGADLSSRKSRSDYPGPKAPPHGRGLAPWVPALGLAPEAGMTRAGAS